MSSTEYRCLIQLKQGGHCHPQARGLYGLYCTTHKHLQFHKKSAFVETPPIKRFETQIVESDQQSKDFDEINIKSRFKRKSIKEINFKKMRENRVQIFKDRCYHSRQKKFSQCRLYLSSQ